MRRTPVFILILVIIVVIAGCGGPATPEPGAILTIDGYGARYIGSGVTGEIDGHDYLFVKLNTEGSEPHVIPGILALDIDDPANPKEVGYLQAPPETLYIAFLAISGTTLYVCASDFLWVVDVSRPSQPERITTFKDIRPLRMAISGDYAYVNDGNRQITVVDITEPHDLRVVGSLPMVSPKRLAFDLNGSVLYIATSQELHVIDISEPATPQVVNTFTATFEDDSGEASACYLRQFTLSDGYAYVILAGEENLETIAVLDLSNPTVPREVSRIKPETPLFGANLFVSGNRLFLYTRDIGLMTSQHRDNFYIYDLSAPDRPELLSSHRYKETPEYLAEPLDGYTHGAGLVNGYLYRFIGNTPNAPIIVTNKLPDC